MRRIVAQFYCPDRCRDAVQATVVTVVRGLSNFGQQAGALPWICLQLTRGFQSLVLRAVAAIHLGQERVRWCMLILRVCFSGVMASPCPAEVHNVQALSITAFVMNASKFARRALAREYRLQRVRSLLLRSERPGMKREFII